MYQKAVSLQSSIEKTLNEIPGIELVDDLLKNLNGAQRADYLFDDRSCIVEQKIFLDTQELRNKGRKLYNFQEDIRRRNGILPDWSNFDVTRQAFPNYKEWLDLARKFTNKFKERIRDANRQIKSTKELLDLQNSHGVALLIFDRIPGIMPLNTQFIMSNALRLNGTQRECEHIDAVLVVCRMKDFLIGSADQYMQLAIRKESPEKFRATCDKIKDSIMPPITSRELEQGFFMNPQGITQCRMEIFHD